MKDKILKSLLFKGIDKEDLDNMFSKITIIDKTFDKGEVIAHEEDKCLTLGLILEGSIEIERIYSSGKSLTVQRLNAGDVFGEALIFSSYGNYPATIEAVTKTNIIFIRKDDILKLCLNESRILENFMTLLSDKVFMLNSKIKSISFKNLNHRVVNYILENSRKQNSNKIELKLTKESIAAYLGMPRPSFSRELIKLRDEKFISFNRNEIEILDYEGLEEKLFE
ncbi:MAG: Crp/Fnr family transcriptional regulator [Clostridiaceae bacterium]|nr:Crp/Fnr family transcriptional regulator [Clostridiaceae bacterium]